MINRTVSTLDPAGRMPNHFATLLSAAAASVRRAGKDLSQVPIAVSGRWVKNGQEFSIRLADLEAMARNFAKRKNEQVVIDYEHASEMPEVARGGPVPAAGWIHGLLVTSGTARSTGAAPAELHALIEWTPEARRLIESGQYRFFSPSIDW
ncbi:MAG TPA: phage protease, partial [Terriglobia bacterium]|nr:phage protease [Terriglobia bacterium]